MRHFVPHFTSKLLLLPIPAPDAVGKFHLTLSRVSQRQGGKEFFWGFCRRLYG